MRKHLTTKRLCWIALALTILIARLSDQQPLGLATTRYDADRQVFHSQNSDRTASLPAPQQIPIPTIDIPLPPPAPSSLPTAPTLPSPTLSPTGNNAIYLPVVSQ